MIGGIVVELALSASVARRKQQLRIDAGGANLEIDAFCTSPRALEAFADIDVLRGGAICCFAIIGCVKGVLAGGALGLLCL